MELSYYIVVPPSLLQPTTTMTNAQSKLVCNQDYVPCGLAIRQGVRNGNTLSYTISENDAPMLPHMFSKQEEVVD